MSTLIKNLVSALIDELVRRHELKRLVERMQTDPRTLKDIGLSLEQFASMQWEAHRRASPLSQYGLGVRTLDGTRGARRVVVTRGTMDRCG